MSDSTTPKVEENGTALFEALECGPSLAELEHGEDQANERKTDHRNGTLPPDSLDALRSLVAADVIAGSGTFTSPFEVPTAALGRASTKQLMNRYVEVPVVYCDQTASNRPVQSIERYVEQVCLPLYGNTHTNTSITGSQSTAFVFEARQIVAEATNAKITGKASLDVVLFAGNGTTAAVELLVDCLGLRHACVDVATRPVVFIGPYEHHSNILPWRESGCEIVMVPESSETQTVDFDALEHMLQLPEYTNRMKMGTFTAASNVTGKVSDVDRIAATLHRHGALAFFDYATAAPYLPMNMNPPPSELYSSAAMVAKDAIFLSPHKMLGGVGTPGVLIVKKHLVHQSNPPHRSGGGTVFYVTNTHHRFLSNRIERYEGGTPNVAGIMKTGLTFLLKRKIEQQYLLVQSKNFDTMPPTLLDFEYQTHRRVAEYWKQHAPNLVLLGVTDTDQHIPIFSFLIRCGKRFLHYNFVCAILNDVFGIQSRGGCQCSGPYSQRLLGLTEVTEVGEVPNARNMKIERALVHLKERAELLRPGYTRLSLPFKGLRNDEVDYVMKAVAWIAANGWALMCQYRCNHRTGEWRHYGRQGKPLGRGERKWLSHYLYQPSQPSDENGTHSKSPIQSPHYLEDAFSTADALLQVAKKDRQNIVQAMKMNDADNKLGGDDDHLEELRWYVYPKECALALSDGLSSAPGTDSMEVCGALRPLGVVTSRVPIDTSSQATCVSSADTNKGIAMDESFNRKRKQSSPINVPKDTFKRERQTTETNQYIDPRSSGQVSNLDLDEHHGQSNLHGGTSEPTPSRGASTQIAMQRAEQQVAVFDLKNQEKKPYRDSNAWGQGNVVPVEPVLVAEVKHLDPSYQVAEQPSPNEVSKASKKQTKHVKPPAKMMRQIIQATVQWEMIKNGDRLLLGLSGGKDSLSLLHCLLEYRRKMPVNFDIEVCTIDPMTPSFDPSPLIPYVESLGLKYHYIRDDIVARASSSGKGGKMVKSLCAFCARMKRGNLYSCARKNNCNKLVLAQHLDDCAESFMMSVMHNGFLRTMKAHYEINAGDLSVIRPMVYCRESLMTQFAKEANLPVINENCPACFEEPKERARIKKLLSREETLYPNVYDNIRRSLLPLMHDDASAILHCYTEEVVSKSRKDQKRKQPRDEDVVNFTTKNTTVNKEDTEKSGLLNEVVSAKASVSGPLFDGVSDEELVKELARRKASRFKLAGAMGRSLDDDDDDGPASDPTGQVCSLKGENGTIPCYELME